MKRGSRIAVLWVGCLLVSLGWAQAGTRVGVLYTGDPYPGHTPYIHMKVEPLLSVTPIQASRDHYAGISGSDIKRAIRVYMPRTYEDLVQEYEVVIISDSNVDSFTRHHLDWFKRAVAEDGRGLLMVGGHETFGTNGGLDWGLTPVGDVLPVDTVFGVYEGGPVRVVDEDHVFMRSLPWTDDLPFFRNYACNIVNPKDGSQVLAISTIDRSKYVGHENPFFSTWDYPPETKKGRTFAMTGDWTPGGGWLFLQWEYLPDFATNLMLYLAQRSIPEDLEMVHTLRLRMAESGYRRMIVVALIDFVEKFGANPRRILTVLGEADAAQDEASDLYLDQEFDQALVAVDRALDLMDDAEKVSEKVKDEALLWVYLSEWLVVSATCMICGIVVWSVMIRRRLYREVRTTSFRESL
jgi:uncharacterized membrane protein